MIRKLLFLSICLLGLVGMQLLDAGSQPAYAAKARAQHTDSDLWGQLRGRFALPGKGRRGSRSAARWYANNQEYLDRVTTRAQPFLYLIAKEVKRRGMPAEIALLPIVESAFLPFANSHSRAVGVWQFIPGTARRFGLKQTWWYDGRRDVLASTNAALDYLQKLHRKFGRDWLLALAAYNCGEGTVAKARKANRRHGRRTDFWSLKLPRETRGYVPQLLGLSRIIANPKINGIHLTPIPNRPALSIVKTGGQIDLSLVAELAGLELAEVYSLNPGFNRWATDPDGPHRLLLPRNKAKRFKAKLAKLPKHKRLRVVHHTVKEGDTLGRIAKANGLSAWGLAQVNKLPRNRVRAGAKLRIPVPRKGKKYYTQAHEQSREAIRLAGQGAQTRELYVVQAGDSLWEIGRAYRVSPKKLAAWNAMATNDPIRPGQTLVVSPAPKKGSGKVGTATANGLQRVHYRVRKGDSLWRIARKFDVTIKQLRKWNKLSRSNHLRQGQKLVVYLAQNGDKSNNA